MREIKFRAWDEKEKCWVSGFAIHQSGMFSDWAGCKKVNGQCIADANWQYPQEIPHIKIMQYTGLKDKNGKEIYEGDIIHDHKYDAGLGKVYWSQEYGGWSVHFFTQYTEQLHEWLVDYNESAEIIGNIYENPELLKGDENE